MGFALSDLQLNSSAFSHGAAIPQKHTGEGEDVSPALSWSNVPADTQSLAVICHDPDAPLIAPVGAYGFVHWVLYNIPADVRSLDEGTSLYTNGLTDFGKSAYGGPMPPPGHGQHHYYFWIMALKEKTALPADLTLWEFLRAVEPLTLGINRLVGTYQRA